MKIGLLITTFLRTSLLQECIDSISKHWNDDYYFIIIDQNKSSCLDNINIPKNIEGEFIKTEFDIGALKSRNIAIKRFNELNIPYILMMADSIMLKNAYNFQPIIEFLESSEKNILCGFDIKNRLSWECDMKKTHCFELDIPRRLPINYKCLNFQSIDICRNFFLAKTELLINNLYDEDRKLADHESFFWRLKERVHAHTISASSST